MVYQADLLLTPNQPPSPNAWIQVQGNTLTGIGNGAEFPEEPVRLPGCVLTPGLINAHCHLELTGLENRVAAGPFPQWVEGLQKASKTLQPSDYRSAAKTGISKLLAGGTTSVLDVGNTGEALVPLAESPLRALGFVEILGLDPKTASERFSRALKITETMAGTSDRFQTGLSPHAVYSCSRELATFMVWHQKARHLPITIHVSESREEFELFAHGSGSLQDFCRGIFPTAPDYRETSAVQILESWGAFSKQTLLVHANHLTEPDFPILARHQAMVVHCPSSHAFFSHTAFPYSQLRKHGIRVCLGTDSLASGTSLSMLDQMKIFHHKFPGTPAAEILNLATENGAAALGDVKTGHLRPGYKADFLAVRIDPLHAGTPHEAILARKSEVILSVIDGKVAFDGR